MVGLTLWMRRWLTKEASVEGNQSADWLCAVPQGRNRHSGNSLKIQDNRALIQVYAILCLLAHAQPDPKSAGSPYLKWTLGSILDSTAVIPRSLYPASFPSYHLHSSHATWPNQEGKHLFLELNGHQMERWFLGTWEVLFLLLLSSGTHGLEPS